MHHWESMLLLLIQAAAVLTFPSLTNAAACAADENAVKPSSCLLQAQPGRSSRFGENRQGERALRALRSQACQAYYQLPMANTGSLAWDDTAYLLRQKTELPKNYFGPELAYTSFQRMLTYEDVAVQPNFSRVKEPCEFNSTCPRDVYEALGYCLPYAVHAAQRPIKVNYLEAGGNTSLLAAAVWKCASTSLTKALQMAPQKTRFAGPHSQALEACVDQNNIPGCQWSTSFREGVTTARWKIATFRHPLARFVASIYEHWPLPSCDGVPCDSVVQQARQQAGRLLKDFPGQWRSCEHATQSYFLSATDRSGRPIAWDFLVEVDNFGRDLQELSKLTNIDLQEMEENSSGDSELKQLYYDAIFADNKTICSVCKVYAQDFTCLGYDFPRRCTNAICNSFGIYFP
ncbi:unnamed protein product [Symbiodinium pilosum]|uniref:Sulfotransferase domain-containing protein n=1 Tax=Symbiodinium pilosum TaxID=2952 RepID=A0A812XDI5_SYMPI|nr:unnamed protein product [Symbiodinium pilosum]